MSDIQHQVQQQARASQIALLDHLTTVQQLLFQGFESIAALNLKLARESLREMTESALSATSVEGLQDPGASVRTLLQPDMEKVLSYGQQLRDIVTAMQAELTRLGQERLVQIQTGFGTSMGHVLPPAGVPQEAGHARKDEVSREAEAVRTEIVPEAEVAPETEAASKTGVTHEAKSVLVGNFESVPSAPTAQRVETPHPQRPAKAIQEVASSAPETLERAPQPVASKPDAAGNDLAIADGPDPLRTTASPKPVTKTTSSAATAEAPKTVTRKPSTTAAKKASRTAPGKAPATAAKKALKTAAEKTPATAAKEASKTAAGKAPATAAKKALKTAPGKAPATTAEGASTTPAWPLPRIIHEPVKPVRRAAKSRGKTAK